MILFLLHAYIGKISNSWLNKICHSVIKNAKKFYIAKTDIFLFFKFHYTINEKHSLVYLLLYQHESLKLFTQ